MSDYAQREAAVIRAEWLGHLLSTAPADRPAAEAAISELYRLIGLDPPRFHWVASPLAALETVPPGARPSETADRLDEWPLPTRFRRLMSGLSVDLHLRIVQGYRPLDLMLQQLVRAPIAASRSTLRTAFRTVYEIAVPGSAWYEAQCVSWPAHYDAVRRTSGVVFTPEQNHLLELWAVLARSCGWWWPREDVCVVSERPVEMHTEVWGDEGQVRLHRPGGCASWPLRRTPATPARNSTSTTCANRPGCCSPSTAPLNATGTAAATG